MLSIKIPLNSNDETHISAERGRCTIYINNLNYYVEQLKETTTNVINEASTLETPEENRTGDKTSAENVGRQFVNVDIEMNLFLRKTQTKTLRKKNRM